MSKENKSRITVLDSLRGIAAISVLLFHYTTQYKKNFGLNIPSYVDFQYGHYGVQLFFVISGFVIFMSIQNAKSIKEFIINRFFRLYPTYWVCLIITSIVLISSQTTIFHFTLKEIGLNFLMFQSLFHISNVDGSYWSLVPELLFYCLMVFLYKSNLLKKTYLVGFTWIIFIFLNTLRPSILDIYLNLRFGMFFLAGIMFYRLKYEKNTYMEHILILLSLVSVYFVRKDFEQLIASGIIFIIFYLFTFDKLSFLNKKALIFLGQISYPLYLFHQTIGYIVIHSLISKGVNPLLSITIALSISIVAAWLIVTYFEKIIVVRLKQLVKQKAF